VHEGQFVVSMSPQTSKARFLPRVTISRSFRTSAAPEMLQRHDSSCWASCTHGLTASCALPVCSTCVQPLFSVLYQARTLRLRIRMERNVQVVQTGIFLCWLRFSVAGIE
jgi:hypothetical protein